MASAVAAIDRMVEAVNTDLAEELAGRHQDWTDALSSALEAAREIDPSTPLPAYLRAVAQDVARPISHALDGPASGERALNAWDRAFERLGGAVRGVPRILKRPEEAHLHQAHPGDSPWTRFRKLLVRVGRGVRSATRWPRVRFGSASPLEHTQTIPLRALAAYHLSVRVPRVQSRAVEEALRQMAPSVTLSERGLADWTNRAMEPADDEQPDPTGAAHEALLEGLTQAYESAMGADRPQPADLALATRSLHRDVAVSGTFMLDPRPYRPDVLARVNVPLDRRWDGFHERAASRASLGAEMAELRTTLLNEIQDFREAVRSAADDVARALEGRAEALKEASPEASAVDGQVIQTVRRDVMECVDMMEQDLRELDGRKRVRAVADELAGGLAEATRHLPAVVHCQAIQDDERVVSPAPSRRDYRLAELAETAFDVLAIEQLRGTAEPLGAHFEAAQAATDEVRTVLDFNLSTAMEDLSQDDPNAVAIPELVTGGIESAAAVAVEAGARLRAGVEEEFPQAELALDQAWSRLYGRIQVEDQRQDELLGAWNAMRTWAGAQGAQLRTALATGGSRLRRTWTTLRSRALGAVRRGRTAVLQPQVTDADVERTLVAIQEADRLTRHLPMVYQRLFAMAPVSDPALTVGRTSAIARVGHLRRRWERSVAPILVVTGQPGAGLTTFLNVISKRLFDDCTVVRVNLKRRLGHPGAFFDATLRAAYRSSGKEPPAAAAESQDSDAGVDPFSSFSAQATFKSLTELGGGRPVVVMVEPMEHLFSRRVGGAQVVEAVLTQLRQSPTSVWWILTASSYAWALLEKLDPNAPTLASRLELAPLDRASLEEVILKRHRKSGLPLHFEMPEGASRRLQAEVRRAPDEEARQLIHRREFFDRLARISGGDLTRAQFYWLRALDLDRQDRLLRVRSRPPLSFAFLSELDLDRAFALKAFLGHASLTPVEYAQITGDTLHRCLVIFESLFGLRLIRPLTAGDSGEPNAVAPDERYQLHPLTARPVVDYLLAQHIIH